jgi:type IV pilus assembly protein PilA
LLIVVAIIGILAGVGIPMYNGYMTKAKIEATKANHVAIKSWIASSFAKCSGGSGYIELPVNIELNGKLLNKIPCNYGEGHASSFEFPFWLYLGKNGGHAGIVNPYFSGGKYENDGDWVCPRYRNFFNVTDAAVSSGSDSFVPCLGQTHLHGSGTPSTLRVQTNIGNESGGNVFLTDFFIKE